MAGHTQDKYKEILNELGFKPIEDLHSKEDIDEVDADAEKIFGVPLPKKLSRAQRRRLVAAGVLPSYAHIAGQTQAFDTTGQEWWANSLVDLKPFGFSFNNEEVLKLAPVPKPKARH
jgi:hypothetical protein